MKSVLISINPKWCELIASGKKTIEVRKTAPKEVPFECYIYCTKNNKRGINAYDSAYMGNDGSVIDGSGKVIGEFICDKIIDIDCDSVALSYAETRGYIDKERCFGKGELFAYTHGEKCVGWHISDLVIYDKPRDLSEFETLRKCDGCKSGYCVSACKYDEDCRVPIAVTRPPQSWMYVEKRHGAQYTCRRI